MRILSFTERAGLVLLASVIALAGCSNDAAGSGQGHGGSGHGAARQQTGPAAALRSGLSGRGDAFYLSLGDSLAQGVQPDPAGRDVATSRGYPDRLAAVLRRHLPHLRLVKLGCSGETTATMIHGGICRYPAGSQLAEAARFLRAHRGRTALVTIDIGANDPNSCLTNGGLGGLLPCVVARLPQIGKNLSRILSTLRAAGGRRVLIVGMTYYVPELGLWWRGTVGRQLGILTGAVAAGANKMLADRYRGFGARVANVFAAFGSSDFGTKNGQAHSRASSRSTGSDPIPPNVATICALTWMCAKPPRGPDEHANDAGYAVIARAFWRAIAARTG
ncbi:MAG TPA: SGNH/GDSL hydrolase family protein [Streptosporangiaceae bacterium]